MGRILQKWDAETHDDILMAMIRHFSPKIEDWRAIVAILREQGHTFSESALQYVVLLPLLPLSQISLSSLAAYSFRSFFVSALLFLSISIHALLPGKHHSPTTAVHL